jgi:hypothetical protein
MRADVGIELAEGGDTPLSPTLSAPLLKKLTVADRSVAMCGSVAFVTATCLLAILAFRQYRQ